ncbi:MAG TPA: hypothetical protein PLU64_03145 [Saprospiraceae bacterium]|nr:hypothetical protein [Saprospiraceae bacterium]
MKEFALSLLSIVCLVAILPQASAQRVDIKRQAVPVQYIALPQAPLNPEFTAYSATISAKPDLLRSCGLTEDWLQRNYLSIPGFNKLNQGGHFHVELVMDDFIFSQQGFKNKTATFKDKDGKETKTSTHWMEIVYALPASLKVTDQDQNVIAERNLSSAANTRTYKSKTFSSYQNIKSFWDRNQQGEIAKFKKELIQSHFIAARDFLYNNYGFRPVTNANSVFEALNSKKHPAYEAHQEALSTLEEAFKLMRPNEPLDAVRAAAEPSLRFWLAEKDRYGTEDKQEAKLRHACLYNLANAYFWLEELELAEQYALEAIAVDAKGRAEEFPSSIEKLRQALAQTGKTSRHFAVEELAEEDIEAAAETAYETEKDSKLEEYKQDKLRKQGVHPQAERVEGKMKYTGGNEVECIFFLDPSRGPELSFLPGNQGNVKAATESESDYAFLKIDPSLLASFEIGERRFQCLEYSPAAQVSLSKNPQIMEVLYESDRVTIYKFYPVATAKAGNTVTELALQKQGNNGITSLGGVKFLNWKKGLSKLFDDCPEVSNQASAGAYQRNEKDLIRLAEAYDNCN